MRTKTGMYGAIICALTLFVAALVLIVSGFVGIATGSGAPLMFMLSGVGAAGLGMVMLGVSELMQPRD